MRHSSGTIGWTTRGGFGFWLLSLAAGAALAGAMRDARADDAAEPAETEEVDVELQKNKVIVGDMQRGGFYCVAKSLKDKHDELQGSVQALRAKIATGDIGGSQEAAGQIAPLQAELESVRKLIEKTKKWIPAGQAVTDTETTEFELGPEKLLFLSGIGSVRLVGWDQPNVKCVLEKTVVGTGKQPLDKQLPAIRIIHSHGPDKELVGWSPEETQAQEEAFSASPAGKNLTPEQLATRRALVEKNAAYQRYFAPFQGKSIDVVEIDGLSRDAKQALHF